MANISRNANLSKDLQRNVSTGVNQLLYGYQTDKNRVFFVCLIFQLTMTPVLAVKKRGKQLAHLAPVNAQQRLIQLWLHDKPSSTPKCYLRYAVSFTAFLGGVGKAIAHATLEDLVEFSEYLHNKKLAAPTIKTYMAAVKSLLSFAYKTGYIKQNPGAAIKLKKLDQRLHSKVLTLTDIALMIRLTERADYRYKSQQIRDVLILKLLSVCGWVAGVGVGGVKVEGFYRTRQDGTSYCCGKGGQVPSRFTARISLGRTDEL